VREPEHQNRVGHDERDHEQDRDVRLKHTPRLS
jgi:hypothetical protein